MSKVTKSERITQLEQIAADQARAFKIMADRLKSIEVESKWIIHMTGIERPQLKQLDQSVFNGAHEMWKFASVDADGAGFRFAERPELTDRFWRNTNCSRFDRLSQSGAYDTADWQNSLIERDVDKELLEVDLSSELTGSGLCKAMLARGDKYVMCLLSDMSHAGALSSSKPRLITNFIDGMGFIEDPKDLYWHFATPINNQGEPLTASEVGL